MSLIWTPAMALLSDNAEAAGLDLAFASALVSLAWAGGQVIGGSALAGLADATADAWAYALIAALFALTLSAVALRRRDRVPAGGGRVAEPRMGAEDKEAENEGGLRRAITPTLLLVFIVGDILGGGIYALVGEVGAETGGAIWSAFLLALVMAAFTAGSYAELVSKYPQAGGAALYVHRAFKNNFLSFIVAFAVVASGITSASALARGFGGDYLSEFVDIKVVLGALALLALITLINLRGISESVKLNVGLTIVEVGGLLLIVLIAVVAIIDGDADTGRARSSSRRAAACSAAMLAGAALAFYALVGFEDSVNVAEETQEPEPHLPEGPVHRPRDRRRPLLPGHRRRLRGRPDRRPDGLQRPAARGRQAGPARDPGEGVLGDRPAGALQRRPDQHDHGLAPALRDGAGGRRPGAARDRRQRRGARRGWRSCSRPRSPRC